MTVPERPGLHLPPHRVAALRGLPEDGRRRIQPPVYPAGRLAVTARIGARPGAKEMILFFDGPADAAQMPPEGV